jgi:hypothetical protein
MELCDRTAYEIVSLIRQRKTSAEEVLESVLERIQAVEGRTGSLDVSQLTEEDRERVHAYLTLTEERARKQAYEVDRKVADGEDPGLLAGFPFQLRMSFVLKGRLPLQHPACYPTLYHPIRQHRWLEWKQPVRSFWEKPTWMSLFLGHPVNPLLTSPARATPGIQAVFPADLPVAVPPLWQPGKQSFRWGLIQPDLSASRLHSAELWE